MFKNYRFRRDKCFIKVWYLTKIFLWLKFLIAITWPKLDIAGAYFKIKRKFQRTVSSSLSGNLSNALHPEVNSRSVFLLLLLSLHTYEDEVALMVTVHPVITSIFFIQSFSNLPCYITLSINTIVNVSHLGFTNGGNNL